MANLGAKPSSRKLSAILMPMTNAIAKACTVSVPKKATPDSRIQMLKPVSSNLAKVSKF